MIRQTLGSGLLILLLTSTASWAAATAEDAARIKATFESYLGTEAGVVTVTPAGEGYDISLDAMPYLNKIKENGFTAKVDPYRFNAVPQGNGLWKVTASSPYKASAAVPGIFNMDLDIGNMEWSGTYNDALNVFMDQTYALSKLSITQGQTDPQTKIVTSGATTIESVAGQSSSTDAGNGLVDGQSTTTMNGLSSSTKMQLPPEMAAAGMPSFDYTSAIKTFEYVSTAKGLNMKPLLDVMAFFVSHPSKELIIRDQQMMKDKLLAALPVFASIDSSGKFDGLAVTTGYGVFGATGGASSVNLAGVVPEGRIAEGFEFNGLTMPQSLPLPPWSKGLIPTHMKIGFDVTGFNAEVPVRKFITEMDVSKPDPVPPGSEQAYLAALLPKNSFVLTVPPGEITAELYNLSYEAVSTINIAGLPQVNAKFRMTGMDKVIAQLQQAPTDPTAQQGMAVLFAAKGISKPDGDALMWEVTVSPEGKVLVNGTDFSAMMGAMSPPPQPPQP
jgi:hypothetical protein